MLLISVLPTELRAQQSTNEGAQRVVVVNPLESARALIDRGDYKAATLVLDALAKTDPTVLAKFDKVEIAFLRGRIAFGERRFEEAARIYEGLLSENPALPRVRLELGRTYFAMKRDRRATKQFELAIADDIGNAAIGNAETFLRQIEERRVFRTRLSFAIVPDSNVNQATASETVDIFGLPFTLNEEARETSDVGVFASGGVEWRPRLSRKVRGSAGFQLQHTDFGGQAFDDTIISGWLGPEIDLRNKYLTLAVSGFRRWFGHEGFNSGLGGRASIFLRPSSRWKLQGQVNLQRIEYDLNSGRDGLSVGTQLVPTFTLGAASQVSAVVGINRDLAESRVWRSTTLRGGLNYYRELPFALVTNVHGDFSWRKFDGTSLAFGATREDKLVELGLQVIKRNIRIFGLSPEISYLLQRNTSNIALYEFTRHRAQIGLTKSF